MPTVFRCPEVTECGLEVFVGLKTNTICLEGPDCWSSTINKLQAVMTLMLTSVVKLSQSLLEVVVLLSDMAAQLVWKLVEYPEL